MSTTVIEKPKGENAKTSK